MAPWLVIGCGYTGTRLARALVGRGDDVTIARRDPAAVEALAGALGARGVRIDLGDPRTLAGVVPPDAVVVVLAPPGRDPAGELRAIAAARPARLVYVSSTGVYAPGGGAWVDEAWPVAPVTASGRARAAAEAALAALDVPWIALRVAGIYGPDRGLAARLAAGTYRVIGDGTRHVSRIHVDDLVAAIIAAGDRREVGGFVNVADDDPAPIGEVADAAAARLGVAAPPRVAVEQVPAEVAAMLTADRRIANARMKRALGVVLRYPSWSAAVPETGTGTGS